MIFRVLLALFSFFIYANCASVLTYNFYSREDSFDILLNFSEPFTGQLRQQNGEGRVLLYLDNVNIKENLNQSANSKFVKNISLTNTAQNSLQIDIGTSAKITLNASKNAEQTAMRIRINAVPVSFAQLGAQEQNSLDSRYISVIIVLGVLCVALIIIKRRMSNKIKKANLSKKTASTQSQKKNEFGELIGNFGLTSSPSSLSKEGVEILFEKNLDEQNKVMLLKHLQRQYLVLVGSSNVLLDHFGEEGIHTQNDFENFFEQNRQRLTSYISHRQNSIEYYKDKLSQE